MTARPPRLQAVPARTSRASGCCEVACQATLSGPQETSVRALTPVSGNVVPMIAVRVGRIVILFADCAALRSMLEACHGAEDLVEQAFGRREGL